jgi:hypothetical protein
VATEEPCSGETLTARLELLPIFKLGMKGEYDPDITFIGSVRVFASIGNATSDAISGVEVFAKWDYREELGDYFELAKDNAALLRGNIERILDRFAEKIAEDLYVAPRATIIVRKRNRIKSTNVL